MYNYNYLHSGDFYYKCMQIYHTWILWVHGSRFICNSSLQKLIFRYFDRGSKKILSSHHLSWTLCLCLRGGSYTLLVISLRTAFEQYVRQVGKNSQVCKVEMHNPCKQLASDFQDSGVLKRSSFSRVGTYIIPGNPYPSPNIRRLSFFHAVCFFPC